MTTVQTADARKTVYEGVNRLISVQQSEAIIADDAVWDVFHPVNRLTGKDEILAGLIRPLTRSFRHVLRRDEIFIGGETVMGDGYWVASMGHFVGTFVEPYCGVQPSGKLVFLRFGEYYRVQGDKIVEAKIIHDLLDLMRQTGKCPPLQDLGTEMMFPGPATHDGVLPNHPERSAASGALVWKMLADLSKYDPVTFTSVGQTGPDGAWDDEMLWYGPGGIGSNYRYEGFERDHRIPYLKAFPDRMGGNHFCRISDGDYVASAGWPSQTLTHMGPYLGVAPTNRPLTLRVMDLWRCEGEKIKENWVLLDLVELLQGMGRDIIAEHQALAS